jgi:hypothetical protein
MSQRKSTKGTKQLGAEVSTELVDEFKRFAAERGETLRYHLELAMRRHLDNPPPPPRPVEMPPLPPVTSSGPKKPRKK